MRRDINWTTKRDDGSRYDVRVTWFSGTFKLQFKERGAERWEYDRPPSAEDWATFLDAIERRYTRRQATYKELVEARRMVAQAKVAEAKPLESPAPGEMDPRKTQRGK